MWAIEAGPASLRKGCYRSRRRVLGPSILKVDNRVITEWSFCTTLSDLSVLSVVKPIGRSAHWARQRPESPDE